MLRRAWCGAVVVVLWACSDDEPAPTQGGGGDSASGAGGAEESGAGSKNEAGEQSAAGGTGSDGGSASAGEAGEGQAGTAQAGAGPSETCDPSACENGGVCPDDGDARCDCPDGFTGRHCELPRFELLELPEGATSGVALGLSEDGSVVVGNVTAPAGQAGFRWTHEGGIRLFRLQFGTSRRSDAGPGGQLHAARSRAFHVR